MDPVTMRLLCVLCALTAGCFVHGLELSCCSNATGSCKAECEKKSLAVIATDPEERERWMEVIKNICPQQLTSFWRCMDQTLEEITKGESWSGRPCCTLPQSKGCQRACITAVYRDDLVLNCRQSDEILFFNCLDRQKAGDECCSNAQTEECHVACKAIFRSQLTPTRQQRDALKEFCFNSSPDVFQCVKNLTRTTPAKDAEKKIHCCDKGVDDQCRDACKKLLLKTKTTEQEIMDGLIHGGCGPPLPDSKLWQCFIQTHDPSSAMAAKSSRIDRTGMDSAKLHCCSRASSSTCKALCVNTFFNKWVEYRAKFDKECLSDRSEERLIHCIDEVDEPCELGCEGLSFCTNFNNRPTELFRRCSSMADDAARYDVALWHNSGYLGLPDLKLGVRNISNCSPETWKAVACALRIKPCHHNSHGNSICREDCHDILNQCIDRNHMPQGETVASLCAAYSPDRRDAPCISIKHFLKPSPEPYLQPSDQVTAPCKGDPCNMSEVCSVNRNCRLGYSCLPYECHPGCKLGEVSTYAVPRGSYVRILANGKKCSQKICQCTENGLDFCQSMPCFPVQPCFPGASKQEHGTTFKIGCNFCVCYSGQITCTKKQCENPIVGGRNPGFTSLPCDCPPHYVPTCGRNGKTYPSSCLARCAGLTDADFFEFGACSDKDPCKPNPCASGLRCVPARKVCLRGLPYNHCRQYTCVDPTSCSSLPHQPVCTTDGSTYYNICDLLRHGKTLAYSGSCLINCDHHGRVCGINGETYASECAALADHVLMDYKGPCISVGLIGNTAKPQCEGVQCPELVKEDCWSVTPPGACCPVCAGALHLLYSEIQVDRAFVAIKNIDRLTVRSLIEQLRRHVQIAECDLYGYLSIEQDLFVLVKATPRNPSDLQLDVCVKEAEKLVSVIRSASPRILSELSLSLITSAVKAHTRNLGNPIHGFSVINIVVVLLVIITQRSTSLSLFL